MCRSASIAPSRIGCTAGPAPAVLSSSAWRSPRADRIYGQAGDHLGCAFCAREPAGMPKRESLRTRRMTQRRRQSKREFTLSSIFLSMF
jgi:hypothetical protein